MNDWQNLATALGSIIGALASIRLILNVPIIRQVLMMFRQKHQLISEKSRLEDLVKMHAEAIGTLRDLLSILREELETIKIRLTRVESDLVDVKTKYRIAIDHVKLLRTLVSNRPDVPLLIRKDVEES